MRSSAGGDMVDADAYSVEELREAVFEGRGRVARPLALALLTRKDYAGKLADLRRILSDEREQPRLRALAASALGEIATPASVRALEGGLESAEPLTMRASAKALAHVGGRKHLEMLERLARTPGAVGSDAQRAVRVLSDRLRLGVRRRADVRTVPLRPAVERAPIRVETPKAAEVASAIKAVPSRKLARRGGVALTCQGRRLVFLFDEAALDRGMGMFQRGGEVGVVAEPPGVEGVEWSPRFLVLVEPEAGGAFGVRVTTHGGRTAFVGRGRAEGGVATFEIAAADVPGALPVEIRGRFRRGAVALDVARSALRRRPSRQPRPEGERR